MSATRPTSLPWPVRIVVSLELTIVCLVLGLVLIFIGTLAQQHLSTDQALNVYFRTVFVWWGPPGASWQIPIFPGGFLVGGVLLMNLLAAHLYRFKFTAGKIGILSVHAGLILLLLGELFTAMFARENFMRIAENETQNYAESYRETELAIIDRTDPATDKVVAIPESALQKDAGFQEAHLPFRITVRGFFRNAQIARRTDGAAAPADTPQATQGVGPQFVAQRLPSTKKNDERDLPVVWVELAGTDGSLGTWMVTTAFQQEQTFTHAGRAFAIEMRPKRTYLNRAPGHEREAFSLQLLDFKHETYRGTDVPQSFSSRVRLLDPGQKEDREVLIYMNHPLRYGGLTFYQAGFEQGDTTTILQVVGNPSRHLPYISCVVVGLGLIYQFGYHLIRFFRRRAALA